jgi:REP element-mobilizing transposase RayT
VDDLREFVLNRFRVHAKRAEIQLIEAETEFDHVHLLLRLKDFSDLPDVMHLLKGACSREITLKYPDLRAEMGRAFWQKSYGARPVPEDQLNTVRWYIRTQDQRPPRHNG